MSTVPVYLDWNATAPLRPEALAEMNDVLCRAWANPSSAHAPGQAARRVLADARARVADFFGAQGAEVVFTSGATEANHAAVLGVLDALVDRAPAPAASTDDPRRRRRLLMSAVEHPGLLALGDRLRARGWPVDLLPVDRDGRLDLPSAVARMADDVALVSVMGANNETGVCMPVSELAALAHAHGALLHVDATQLAGKAALDFGGPPGSPAGTSGQGPALPDLMSVSAHKIGGPKGVGALLVRKGLRLEPHIAGRQERQRRGGTENLAGIAGFAAACGHLAPRRAADLAHMRALRDRLESGLVEGLPGTRRLGAAVPRIANTTCLSFAGIDAEPVLARLERAGVIAASGAACGAGRREPSHVLLAMGLDAGVARSGVRFSLGPETTAADIERALAAAAQALGPLVAEAHARAPAGSTDPIRAC